MLSISSTDLEPRAAYHLLISVVVPRPIGWASTIGRMFEMKRPQ